MNSLTKDQASSIFAKVVETCEKKLYDPRLNGVDWRRIAETRRQGILAAADEAEFEREFNDLIRELRVSHAGFYHERRPRAAGKMAISATLFKRGTTAAIAGRFRMCIRVELRLRLALCQATFSCASERSISSRPSFRCFPLGRQCLWTYAGGTAPTYE